MTLKSSLVDFIEPDFELLDHLLRRDVLNYRQIPDIRSEITVFRRNDALLDLLKSKDQCVRFLKALQETDQQHVVNFVTQNGGQRHNHVTTYVSNVPPGDKQSNRIDCLVVKYVCRFIGKMQCSRVHKHYPQNKWETPRTNSDLK